MNLAVLPDGRVLHTTRAGEVRLHNPRTGLNTLAATIDVYRHDEEGLRSVAIDPNFETNRWVYAYYSPPLDTPVDDPETLTNEGDAPETDTPADFAPFKGVIRLSRFKMTRDTLDLATEEKIIEVPVDRGICCHVGGDIDLDANALQRGDERLTVQHRPRAPSGGHAAGRLVLVRSIAAVPRARAGPEHGRHRADGRPGVQPGPRQQLGGSASQTSTRPSRSSTSDRATTSRSSASTTAGWGEIRPFPVFVDNPMDMEYGPDGALYVLEYGDGYFAENPDAQLAKINFVRGNHTPVPKVAATPTAGRAPLEVEFSSAGTNDSDGDPFIYEWDFEANGSVDLERPQPDPHLGGERQCRGP